MKVKLQKKLAASVSRKSPKKVFLDPSRLPDIRDSITREDIRELIKERIVKIKRSRGVSRGRKRHVSKQKIKGRRKGHGSRKGTKNARLPDKRKWINKIRLQRKFLKDLKVKGKLTTHDFRMLYLKSKGDFFRNKRHIKLYINENGLIKDGK